MFEQAVGVPFDLRRVDFTVLTLLRTNDGMYSGAFNGGRYSNPTYDALIDAVRTVERKATPGAEGPSRESYCHACFSGNYPIPFAPNGRAKHLRMVTG